MAPAVTPRPGTRSQSGGIDIVSLPVSGLPATIPVLGTRTQSGGIGIISQTCVQRFCRVQKRPHLGISSGCGHAPTTRLQGLNNRGCYASQIAKQVHDGVLAENLTKFSTMQGVYENLTECVCCIDTAQHYAGNHAMALAEVQDPSTNIPEDVTKLTRWGSGKINIVIQTRTIPISC